MDEILCFLGSLVIRLSFAMSLCVCSVVVVGRIISFSCCCIGHTLLSSSWLFFFLCCVAESILGLCFHACFFVLRIYSLVDMHFSCKFIKSFLPWQRALSLCGVQTIHTGVVLLEDKIESSEEKAFKNLLSVSNIIAFKSLVCEDFM